jgi:hypothetical protein
MSEALILRPAEAQFLLILLVVIIMVTFFGRDDE